MPSIRWGRDAVVYFNGEPIGTATNFAVDQGRTDAQVISLSAMEVKLTMPIVYSNYRRLRRACYQYRTAVRHSRGLRVGRRSLGLKLL